MQPYLLKVPFHNLPLLQNLLLEILRIAAHFTLYHLAQTLNFELLDIKVRQSIIELFLSLKFCIKPWKLVLINVPSSLDLLARSQITIIALTLT